MNRRSMLLLTAVATLSSATSIAAAGTSAAPRSRHAWYVGAHALIAANGTTIALAGVQPYNDVIQFAVPRSAARVALRVVDTSGKAVAVNVVMYRSAHVAGGHIVCAATQIRLRIPKRVNSMQVIPLAGECGSALTRTTSVPTTGTVTATFEGQE
jgi:hypothetical protein